jgi:Cdc6-like AAA superfamily ATPase
VKEINEFVRKCEVEKKLGCRILMVSGSPGLGKTLSVSTVLETTKCEVISFNANRTRTFREVQQKIYEKLLSKRGNSNLTTQQIIRALVEKQVYQTVFVYIEEIETAFDAYVDDYSL